MCTYISSFVIMEQICIVALIGLPAVGKTTMSKFLLETEPKLPFNVLHINYDNFINSKPDSSNVSYKEQRADLLVSLTTLVKSLKVNKKIPNNFFASDSYSHEAGRKEQLMILCDDNHYYRSMRYKLYQMARQLNLAYGQIYFEFPTDLALKRNNLRCGIDKVPVEAFHRMALYLEPPQPVVYEWELNTLNLPFPQEVNKKFIFSSIIPFVATLFAKPLVAIDVEQGKFVATQSQVHDLDVIIRKKIGMFLSSKVDINKQQLAQMLNEKKNIVLKKFQDNKSPDKREVFEKCVKLFEEYLDGIKV